MRINFVKNDFFFWGGPPTFWTHEIISLCEKKNVLVSCLFWQCSADLFVSHISTTMQADVFWRLILGCFLKQTKLAFWSLLFMWPRAQRHSCKRLSSSINIKLEDILCNFASFCYYKTCFIYQIKNKKNTRPIKHALLLLKGQTAALWKIEHFWNGIIQRDWQLAHMNTLGQKVVKSNGANQERKKPGWMQREGTEWKGDLESLPSREI